MRMYSQITKSFVRICRQTREALLLLNACLSRKSLKFKRQEFPTQTTARKQQYPVAIPLLQLQYPGVANYWAKFPMVFMVSTPPLVQRSLMKSSANPGRSRRSSVGASRTYHQLNRRTSVKLRGPARYIIPHKRFVKRIE